MSESGALERMQRDIEELKLAIKSLQDEIENLKLEKRIND